jgi:hypothetical protein
MAGFGRRFRVEMLKYAANQTPAASPTISVGFSTADPGDAAATIAEPTIGTGGYARQTVSWTAIATPTAGSPAVMSNSAQVTWGPSSAAWSSGATPLSHVAYWTASTGVTEAVYVASGSIAVPPQVNAAGVTLTAAIGALQLTLAPT